jgi:FMN phosphatase YigB (HAD superfamily)
MNASSVVALDVDGVLGDFETHWRECAEEVLGCRLQGRPLLKVNEQHSMGLRYGLSNKEVDAVWRVFHEDPLHGASRWADLPLYHHAPELVLALEDLGCMVWAVTSIDVQHRAARAESLAGLIPAGRIVCVGHAAPASAKTDVLRDLGAVAFLDDHPANANAALGLVSLPVLLDRGYHGLEAPEYGVTVIDDVMDFPVLVEQLLRRTGRAA